MYTPKAIVATVAVMAGLASALNVTYPPTNFTLESQYPGCVSTVTSECGIGCEAIAVLSATKNCDQIGEIVTKPACSGGIVSIDLRAGALTSAFFESGTCRASCIFDGGSCHSSMSSLNPKAFLV